MATLAKSAVALYNTASEGIAAAEFHMNRPSLVVRRLTLTLTGQGGQTNTITAHALGFSKLVSCSALWDATNSKGYPATIDPVNNILILLDGSAAPAPVDVTATAYITVWGVLDLNPALT
jgi:hypothetical protein